MARARCQIHDLGGVEATNSYTRLYLALGNVLPWSYVPAIPPELILIPSWFFEHTRCHPGRALSLCL